MNEEMTWWTAPIRELDARAMNFARERNAQLTKPLGSLGRLETLAIHLAGMQGVAAPRVDRVRIVVFAADHGIAEESISAFPQSVTLEMVRNFSRGGAAINVLAGALGAELEVVDVGTAIDPGPLPRVVSHRVGNGTANFSRTFAMTDAQVSQALDAGRAAVQRAAESRAELLIGGEMGIGNTTSAAALGCALLGARPEDLAGPGTGLDTTGIDRKCRVIHRALDLHGTQIHDPRKALRCLGGFEIAALTGAYVAAAQYGIPVLIDGFISTAAALVSARLCPEVLRWLLFAHASAEPGHVALLKSLQAEPLLQLGMRLGEGSGAAVAVPLLRLACALHSAMATFADAGVSQGGSPACR